MDQYIVFGGQRLQGEVQISGAKNAALPLLAASLLTSGKTVLENVPDVGDIETMVSVLGFMGVTSERVGERLIVDSSNLSKPEAPYDLVRMMRASVLVLGPLLARYKQARVSLPGGCAIGTRPINLHLAGLAQLGATIELRGGYIEARCEKLRGTAFRFEVSTVTGTENLLMAAVLAEGRTILENASREPEVVELADFLNEMGANIRGAGSSLLVIEGVAELHPTQHRVRPDRIEAATYLAAAIITQGDVLVKECPHQQMDAVLEKYRAAGAKLCIENENVRLRMEGIPKAVDVRTRPYPGFPTDVQAQIMAVMSIAEGRSAIAETVFESRFRHVSELRRMGADIVCEGSMAVVRGMPRLDGAPVMATDLRAGVSLLLAGLVANGVTEIRRIYHLDRAYPNLETKFEHLGAKIKRVRT